MFNHRCLSFIWKIQFYSSATGASLADDEIGLYGQSALFVFGLFCEEYVIDESNGKAVATTTAWFGEKKNHPIGVVHALSCLPKHQSLGLGRFVAAQMMYCFYELMPGAEIWLDTQTWSYKAVGIYMDLGFVPMKTATFNEVPNEYDEAVRVLKDKMRPDIYQRFINTAE